MCVLTVASSQCSAFAALMLLFSLLLATCHCTSSPGFQALAFAALMLLFSLLLATRHCGSSPGCRRGFQALALAAWCLAFAAWCPLSTAIAGYLFVYNNNQCMPQGGVCGIGVSHTWFVHRGCSVATPHCCYAVVYAMVARRGCYVATLCSCMATPFCRCLLHCNLRRRRCHIRTILAGAVLVVLSLIAFMAGRLASLQFEEALSSWACNTQSPS